jgi:hypothetical protein
MSFTSKSHPEAEERDSKPASRSAPSATPWLHYTDEQKAAVQNLVSWQVTLSAGKDKPLSDASFCKPAGADPSAWNRVKNGKYGGPFNGNIDQLLTTLRRHYLPQQKDHFTVAHTKVILDGIDAAQQLALASEEKRAYWMTGDTGVGKTTLAHDIAREKGGLRIHASPAWKTSYTVILRSVARKLGVLFTGEGKKRRELRQTEPLENAIADKLNNAEVPPVLVFEEVRPFNQRCVLHLLFFWIFLLNETRSVLVILSAPKFFDAFAKLGGEDAAQFLRRTKVVAADNVDPSHAKATLTAIWPDAPDLDESAKALASAAATLGGFDLLKEVSELLKGAFKTRPPKPADVLRAITHYDNVHQFTGIRFSRKQAA